MTDPSDRWFPDCVKALNDPRNQRVWSIIVTVFGDLAQRPGDRLSGAALSRIIEPLGVRPEAIRVALHRLRKDGWLESAREGRESRHFLTEYGRAQSAAVTPRIYDPAPEVAQRWHVLIAGDAEGLSALSARIQADGHIGVGDAVALGRGPLPDDTRGFLGFEIGALRVPDWLQRSIIPPDLNAACRDLMQSLEQADALMPPGGAASPVQTATLRTLIVHRWRRVVLRHPDLPADFYPADWPGAACRDRVFRLLDRLPRPPLAEIERAVQ